MSIDVNVASVTVILKELGIPLRVSSKRDRIAMQKGVYLAQRAGVDLGYRFTWYINGPYSAKLADAYYQADEEKEVYEGFEADREFSNKLKKAKRLIEEKPDTADLPEWLEAVGSLDYMIKVGARSVASAIQFCKQEKPHLACMFEPAKQALIKHAFITAA